jgi:hypothetical protein
MPIRFRCNSCNQLLGIAHRKAGSRVRCPTCSGQVVVPDPDEARAPEHAAAPLFERSDFDEVFNPGQPRPESRNPKDKVVTAASLPDLAFPSPPPLTRPHAAPEYDAERIVVPPAPAELPPAPPGIFLSPVKATLLTIAVIVALGVAFTAGFFVGFLMRPA